MKIYPYQTPEGVIELVEKREYDEMEDALNKAKSNEADSNRKAEFFINANFEVADERNKLRTANAELIQRLAEARESHLHASARDVQTIQRQSVMLERLAGALRMIDEHPCDFTSPEIYFWHARDQARSAISAYESANLEPVANPIDEAVKRMDAVPVHDLKIAYRKGAEILGLQCDGVESVRARLISAAKGTENS